MCNLCVSDKDIYKSLAMFEPRRRRAARDAQLFHEQRDEPEAVPLLERPMGLIERHGPPVPAVLVARDLSRLEDNGRRQRESEKRQRAERVGRALLQPRLRRQGRHRVLREHKTARRRRVQPPRRLMISAAASARRSWTPSGSSLTSMTRIRMSSSMRLSWVRCSRSASRRG